MKRKILYTLSIIAVVFLILFALGLIQRGEPVYTYFSNDFYYSYEQKAIFGKSELIDIPPDIVKYSADKKYVLAIQKPRYMKDEMYDYDNSFSYINGLNNEYYWIINLDKKIVIGPLLYKDFIDKFKIENINESLLMNLLENNRINIGE